MAIEDSYGASAVATKSDAVNLILHQSAIGQYNHW